MSDVTLTIDGVEVTVPKGTNVVEAARRVGIQIPVFCYHPRIRSVGMCRMCLVAVGMPQIDRATGERVLGEDGSPQVTMLPKLQTACTTSASDGMVIKTDTNEVKYAQRGIVEFLLTSHPLDCPVCDKGGECPLQNLTMEWGPGESRFDYADKAHFDKPVPLGDLIYLDRERCILCGRCVRFQDDIAGDHVLGFFNRGRKWHIISKSEPPFDSKLSGNTTDICPVGALTTADFRFKARVWEVKPVPSLCNLCSVGCNTMLDMRHNEIKRVMPRENSAVNDLWLCDKGRFAHHFVHSDRRVTRPMVRRNGSLVEVTWEEAIMTVADNLAAIYKKDGGEAIMGIAGEHLANEDLYLFQRLFRDVLGSNNLDHRIGTPGDLHHDEAGATMGVGSGTNVMSLSGETAVLVIGADPEEEAPIYRQRLRGIAQRGGEVMVINTRATRLDESASKVLHVCPGSEHLLVRGIMAVALEEVGVKHFPTGTSGVEELKAALKTPLSQISKQTGVGEDDIRDIAQRFVKATNGIIIYGADALALGQPFTKDLGNLAMLTGKVGKPNNGLIALLPRGNSRGALDMGVRPDKGAGYAPLTSNVGKKADTQRGLTAREAWGAAREGRLKALYLMGVDPVGVYSATKEAIEKASFVVVQDLFLSETAELADVVLPVTAFSEREGTYTNAERRVQRARKAQVPPEGCRPDWEIIRDVAMAVTDRIEASKALDKEDQTADWEYYAPADVALDIAERVAGYRGITYSALAKTGQSGKWGRQVNEPMFYEGTSYRNTEGVGMQWPSFAEQPKTLFSVKPRDIAKEHEADDRYPFVMLVQRVLYDNDPFLQGSLLENHVPEPTAALNPNDAKRLAVEAGDNVTLSSKAGTMTMVVRVEDGLPEGSVLVPTHLADAPLSQIQTGPRTQVAVQKAE